MTSIISLPFLILFVYLFLAINPPAFAQTSSISDLENQIFFRQYDGEADTARLSRIEKYIFGQAYNDAVEKRIARVRAAIPQTNTAPTPQSSSNFPNDTSQTGLSPWVTQPSEQSNNQPNTKPNIQTSNDNNEDYQSRQLEVMAARASQVNSLLSQAVSLYRQKQYDQAIDLFEQVTRLDPQNASAHFSLGVALEAKGDSAQAATEYKQAATIDPDNKDYQQATQDIKTKVDQESKSKLEEYKWQALASQADDALKNGLLDQALAMYTQLIEKDPRQPLYQYNVGTIYLMQRRPEDALPHYKSAHKLDPGNKVYVESLDKLEQGLKEAKEAKEKAAKEEANKNKAAKEWTAKTNAKPVAPKKIDLYANFGLDVKSSRLGVMVKRLKPGWRGAQVGLYPNDIIKSVDGVEITQVSQLEQMLGNKPIGERFQMVLIRRGMACQLMF